ncbi:MAG TPA: hypothetical protein VGP99_10270 [Tepidisphaeraceae bacterium]|nr:hypothetical protein [Tepidisphaeraceae bacterium]
MNSRARMVVRMAAAAALVGAAPVLAAPVDFQLFPALADPSLAQGIPTTFVNPVWSTPTDFNGFTVAAGSLARETTNSDTTLFYGPSSLTLSNKIITGDIYAGNDDDYIGIGLGVPADSNPMLNPSADFLLLQWKGLSQNFEWNDRLSPGDPGYSPFHDSTLGGAAPAGLSLSRVKGLPTADEYWQRADLTMYDPQGKRNPDPLVDPPFPPGTDSGDLTELGRGLVSGNRSYGPHHRFEINYTPQNIKVFVDGALEFDINAPTGQEFPEGTLALYEQAQDPSGAFAFFDVRNPGDPAPPTPPLLISPIPFGAADISVTEGTTNATSVWSVVSSTSGAGAVTLLSAPNVADVDITVGGAAQLTGSDGVLMATVRHNGPRSNGNPDDARYAVAEAPFDSGFGGIRLGIATADVNARTSEWNVDVAAGFFPYSRFRGGYVTPQGTLRAADDASATTPYTITQKQVPLPSIVKSALNLDGTLPAQLYIAGNQQFITNLKIRDQNGLSDGLLLTVGASNENNYTSVAPLADGTWNIAVRDADHRFYGGPDTFERDNFAFLYLEPADMPGSVGGRVTELNAGQPAFAQKWGDYTLSRVDTGVYQLAITGGETFTINIVGHQLTGDLTVVDQDTNGDGTPDQRTITDTQDLVPGLVDSAFSFAFIPFEEGVTTGHGMLLLTANDTITLTDGTVAPLNYWLTYESGTAPEAPRWLAATGGSWNDPANWSAGVPVAGTNASFSGDSSGPRTITLDGDQAVANLNINDANSHTIAPGTGGTLSVSSAIGIHQGSHTISAPLNIAGNVTVRVDSGAALTSSGGLSIAAGRFLRKMDGGDLTISGTQSHGAGAWLMVSGGTMHLNSDGGTNLSLIVGSGAGKAVLGADQNLDNLIVNTSEAGLQGLDLNSPAVAGAFRSVNVFADDLLAARKAIHAAIFSAVATPGDGIFDSSAAARGAVVGVATVGDHVLVRPARVGDLNLDGSVSISDFIDLASNFNSSGATWQEGDLNGDLMVTISDFIDLASNFNSSYAGASWPISASEQALLAEFAAAHGASVPEPGGMSLMTLAAAGLFRRRARKRHRSPPRIII